MNADCKGALEQINTSWRFFEHKGQPMTKEHVKAVLEHAVKAGYKTVFDIPESDIDEILKQQ